MDAVDEGTVFVVRHGATDAGARWCAGRRMDPPLNAEGQAQARAAAAACRIVDRIVTSPALRAQQTAAAWRRPMVIDERLWERDFGSWEGQPWADLWDQLPPSATASQEAYAAWTPPGAETLEQVWSRVAAARRDWSRPGRRVVLVTHAGPLRLLVTADQGLPLARAFGRSITHGEMVQLRSGVVLPEEHGRGGARHLRER